MDLSEVRGMTPSFFDETLTIVEEAIGERDNRSQLTIASPPTDLSSKYVAIGRAHRMSVRESEDGDWVISAPEVAAAS